MAELKAVDEKEAFLKEHKGKLDVLRRALRHRFERPSGLTPAIMAPHYENFRAVARLLALDGQVRESKDDMSGAVRSYLDAVQFGSEIQRDGWMVDFLIGNATEVTGRQPIWPLIGKLNGNTALAAARRLEMIEAQHYSFAEVLRGELEYSLRAMKAEWEEGKNLPFDRERALEEYRRLMEGEIAAARRPYQTSGQKPAPYDPAKKELEEDEPQPKLPMDAARIAGNYFGFMKPALDMSRFDYTRTRAQNAMLVVALMIRAFEVNHGRLPGTLNELVPQYLQAVPVDPFGHGEPLQYQRKDDGYLLYSVGPDGKDDGGRPIPSEDKEHEARQKRIKPDGKGDIVAGINR